MSLNATAALAPILGLDYTIKNLAPSGYPLDKMITSFPDHIKEISDVILSTSKETLQTFLIWSAIGSFVTSVLAPEVEPLRQLQNSLSGRVRCSLRTHILIV
jgi:endothelin-converting enzyme